MAQMTLITGVPGDGKSLLAITKGLAFVAEGRTVYAAGFKELNYEATGFKELPSPFEHYDPENLDDTKPVPLIKPDWMLLEGSVIIYDECYSVLPARSAGKPVPVYIQALARHRHYNIDLIFVTQKHDQLDNFIRGLIKEHIHVKRQFGLNGAVLRTWSGFQLNTNSKPESAPLWKYPKKNFALYVSATAHTIKRKLPWYMWAFIPLLVAVPSFAWYAWHSFAARGTAAATGAPAPGVAAAPGSASDTSGQSDAKAASDALRRKDYAAWLHPRIAGQPWTAPAYDQLSAQGVPKLYCAAVEDGDCKCITEQGTKYQLDKGICRTIARDGVYNPFQPVEREQMNRRQQEPTGDALAFERGERTARQLGGATGIQRGVSIPQQYLPPEYHPSKVEE